MESPAEDAKSLRRRNTILAALHLIQATAALLVLALIVWRIRVLITLAQRSNVETLVLAFIVVFLLYILATSARAAVGSVQLFAYRLMGERRAQQRLQRKARSDPKKTQRAHLNVVVRGPGGKDIEIPLEDRYGKIGTLRIHLTEITFEGTPEELTASMAQLVAIGIKENGTLDGTDHEPKIVYWDGINEEQAEQYASEVSAFDRLERALGKDPLWPVSRLDRDAVEKLTQHVRQAIAPVRESLLLPDIEYQAEFSVPVIPEPFAFFQLKRRKEHADPVASMGCATIMTVFFLIVIAWVIANPPWVPGK